jgi:hypothetical protein
VSVGHVLTYREASELATGEAPASKGIKPEQAVEPRSIRPSRGRPPKLPESLEAYIDLWSQEFHDEEHIPQNRGQLARLYKASGKSEDTFRQLMVESREITKKRGNIEKRARGERGSYGLRNRMPYFFSVLRDHLGLKEAEGE